MVLRRHPRLQRRRQADIVLHRDHGVIATWQMDGTHIAAENTISPLAIPSTVAVHHYNFL
jgi:hypothetical protein